MLIIKAIYNDLNAFSLGVQFFHIFKNWTNYLFSEELSNKELNFREIGIELLDYFDYFDDFEEIILKHWDKISLLL